jgi:hypothetical protein
MIARRELRDDAAVVRMHRHLRVQGVGEEPAAGIVQRDTGLIARRFDAKNDHSGMLFQRRGLAGVEPFLV